MEKRLTVNAAYLQYLKVIWMFVLLLITSHQDKRSYMESIVKEFNGEKAKTQSGAIQNGYSMTGSQKIKYPMQ